MKYFLINGLLSVLWFVLAKLELQWWDRRKKKKRGEEASNCEPDAGQ